MRLSLLALGGLTAIPVLAIPSPPTTHAVHERRSLSAATKWQKRDRMHGKALMPMRIGLTQTNLDKGHDMLMDISDISSPNYGKHLTPEEVHDLFAPHDNTVETVRSWLNASGIHAHRVTQSTNKQWIQFDAEVEEVERLLHTEYHTYEHETGHVNVGCDKYHLPKHVQEHVDYVTPGVKLMVGDKKPRDLADLNKRAGIPKPKVVGGKDTPITGGPPIREPLPIAFGKLAKGNDLSQCDSIASPGCIKAMYNISNNPTSARPGNQLGIFESLNDKYSQADLNLFWANFANFVGQGTHPFLNSVDGGSAPVKQSSAGGESDLDFEIAMPIVYPDQTILYQVDDDVYEAQYAAGTIKYPGFLNTWLDAIDGSYCSYSAFGETGNDKYLDPVYPDTQSGGYKGRLMCGVFRPASVISISYGAQESDFPAYYQKRQCNEFMKLGLQGVTVVVASGDSGVGTPSGSCTGSNGKVFSPDFPATCPYITVAGATYLPKGASAAADAEVAVTRFASGGGFSNLYATPSYQQSQVNNYLSKYAPTYSYYKKNDGNSGVPNNGGLYNRQGRGYPDVSAVGDNVVVVNQGQAVLYGGTSCAAPVVAAIFTRINGERKARGKSAIGFANPTLYANPQAFHDITVGNNPGCGTQGFKASPGWDPVTGLGTPNYSALLSVFLR